MNYTFRMHDPRVGRFFARDPFEKSYPWNSSYAFSENRVIASVELEGLEPKDLMTGKYIIMPSQPKLEKLSSKDCSFWADMLQWEKSAKYKKAFEQAEDSQPWGLNIKQQKMCGAFGRLLNTDYYAIKITKRPKNVSEADLFQNIKQNFENFMEADIAELVPNMDNIFEKLWKSYNPFASVMVFHNLMDDAPVFTSQNSPNHWIFAPIFSIIDASHPLAGHREFGLSNNGDSSSTF